MASEISLKQTSNDTPHQSGVKILILGNGYMGNHMYNHLAKYDTTLVSASTVDYHNPQILNKYLLNEGIGLVINCSGFTGRPNIDEAETKKELCYKLNVESPLMVNRMCDRLNIDYLHISSGCVFEGYQREWTEEDVPNYGFFENHSSFYSKTKHLFEMLSKDLRGRVLRIRMPFGPDSCHRNYLSKIKKYDKLIDFQNSKTYIPDLCNFVERLIEHGDHWVARQTYNVVNPGALWTSQVCDIMERYNAHNGLWTFVPIRDLEIVAGRSNCILDSSKVNSIYQMKTETEALNEIYAPR